MGHSHRAVLGRQRPSIDAIDWFDGKVSFFMEKCRAIRSQWGSAPGNRAVRGPGKSQSFTAFWEAPPAAFVRDGRVAQGRMDRVKERFVEIPTADGRMETFVTHPEQDGAVPAGRALHGRLGCSRRAPRPGASHRDGRLLRHGAGLLLPAGQDPQHLHQRQGRAHLACQAQQGRPGQGSRAGEQARRQHGGRGHRRDPEIFSATAAIR